MGRNRSHIQCLDLEPCVAVLFVEVHVLVGVHSVEAVDVTCVLQDPSVEVHAVHTNLLVVCIRYIWWKWFKACWSMRWIFGQHPCDLH